MAIFFFLMLILYIVYDNAKAKEKVRKYHEDDAKKYGKGKNFYDQYIYAQLIEEDLDRRYREGFHKLYGKEIQSLKDFDNGKISQEALDYQLQKLKNDKKDLRRSLTDGKMTNLESYAYGMARLWAYREGYIPLDMNERPASENCFDPFDSCIQYTAEHYLMAEFYQPSCVPNAKEMEATTERRLHRLREDQMKRARGEIPDKGPGYSGTNQEYHVLMQRLVYVIEQEQQRRMRGNDA